mgnify:CR=1 FL=1
MRGVYTATIDIANLEINKTLIYFETPSSMCVEILGAYVTNRSLATNQQFEIAIMTNIIPQTTPTGTTIVPVPTESYSGTTNLLNVLGDITANEPDYSSAYTLHKEGSSAIIGFNYDPIPECRHIVGPSKMCGIILTADMATAFDATIEIIYREIG